MNLHGVHRELQTIPGVGPSIAKDLTDLGIRRVSDLRGRSPERLYESLNARRGQQQDRCLLYVFRCAVYFAENFQVRRSALASLGPAGGAAFPRRWRQCDPELLKWWNWKDANLRSARPRARAR